MFLEGEMPLTSSSDETRSLEPDILLQKKKYKLFFLTVPPNFQYQNEKRWAANQRF